MNINSIATENVLAKLSVSKLRPQQEQVLPDILSGKDVTVVMPTGGGKSLLYQAPAIMDNDNGLTVVISPLKSLQKDQINHLKQKGIKAELLNSTLSSSEHSKVLHDMCESGGLLYLAPEQLLRDDVANALKASNLKRVVIDEAHILVEVKDDFRKAYGEIGKFISSLQDRPQVIALTATATKENISEIKNSLNIEECNDFRFPVRRENLELYIKRIDKKKSGRKSKKRLKTVRFGMVERAVSELKDGSAIVFCTTVKMTKQLYKFLDAHGYKVGKYHGKMKNDKREKAQQDFISGKTKIMVATNAFGLGIDKPDIRLVVHASLPLSMDGYIQEIGRAGRDGEKSKCVLIYADSDFFQNERILKSGDEQSVKRKLKGLAHLKKFVNTQKCLWRFIEKYFGESKKDSCKKCCNCRLKKL